MKKIFMVSGEESGDALGGWYLRKCKDAISHVVAVGGKALKQEGASIFMSYKTLNVTGIFEIIKDLPHIFRCMNIIVNHIKQGDYNEVVLIDFPGFNLRLARRLKKEVPRITITYLSPPQMWVWGAWRIKTLRSVADRIIVLYPFEVAWYKERGMCVEWIGSPHGEKYEDVGNLEQCREKKVALLPGSRTTEVARLLPLMVDVARKLKDSFGEIRFVLPRARSISHEHIEAILHEKKAHDLAIHILEDSNSFSQELKTCCFALTKPGTITLELALLSVPSIVMYKTSWLTYLCARPFVRVPYMALPNLLAKKEIFPEFIQSDCTHERVMVAARRYYEDFCKQNDGYQKILKNMREVRKNLITSHQKAF